jgi:hypothetical protein
MTTTTILKPGTIVGDTSFHDPARRIRFGVVLAPEPSERVRRIISDDPAIWRPAVAELCAEVWPGDYSALAGTVAPAPVDEDEETATSRCDYCGKSYSIRKVSVAFVHTYTSDSGQGVFTTGIYCSDPCAELSANRSGSSRG